MNNKTKQLKVRLNLQIDNATREMSNILREKHHLNISSLCRQTIIDKYNELEKLEND